MSVGASHRALESKPTLERVSVLEGHALWAESYDQAENPLLALEERMMESLLPATIKGFVLDVACGTGRWLRRLLQHGAWDGMGVDFSAEMLAQASSYSQLQGKLIHGDCLTLPFPKAVADFVLCAFALGYVEDIDALASELGRVTKSGASIWISDFHPEGHARGWKRAFRSGGRIFEIASNGRTCQEIQNAFHRARLRLARRVDAYLGVPERKFFERAGKLSQFESARKTPAVLIMEYRHDDIRRGQP